jgi:Protein of unknown function (DUF2946)
MRWLRDHIRQGSWLALVALAINFVMTFGHIHPSDRTGSERAGLLIAAALDGDRSRNHPADNRSDDLCPICMAAAAMGTALAPTPAALPVEFADAAIDHAIEHAVATPHAPRAAFQSRGPPIS